MSDFTVEARTVCDACGQMLGLWHKDCDGSWVTEMRTVTPWTRKPLPIPPMNTSKVALRATRADGGPIESHLSSRGAIHIGKPELCASIDCLAASLPVREGDVVRVVIPDAGIDGAYRATSEPEDLAGSVTLRLEATGDE